MDRLQRVGMIARWRPVHLGHVPVLRGLCDGACEALIGIGSSNRYDFRNPFTLQETIDMIQLVLEGRTNYILLPVPDLDDGPAWRVMVVDLFGRLDLFVTDNPYVSSLMREVYRVARPIQLVAEEDRIPVDGTLVRRRMARAEAWQELVPTLVRDYIATHGLDQRFRREFGLRTLAMDALVR